MADPSRNAWLDFCRALAILLVLLSHGRFFLRDQFPAAEALRFGGFLGVELFFALSGFLIGGILLKLMHGAESQPWRNGFYARRWLRTLPNYYLFLALNLLLLWSGIRPAEPEWRFWPYLLFLQNLAYPSPAFFTESWSLAVEELFYLGFPLLILALARMLRGDADRAMVVAALLIIGGALAGRMLVADGASSWDEQVRKVAMLRLDALMFGVLLAWLLRRGHPLLARRGLLWGGVLIFLACTAYAILRSPAALDGSWFAKTFYLSLTPLGCAAVVAVGLRWRLPVMMATVAGFLARVSYSAYLVNIPVAMVLLYFSRAHATHPWVAGLSWGLFMAATLLAAWCLYRWVEQPFLRFRDARYPGPGAVPA